jgi:hypothetical protein
MKTAVEFLELMFLRIITFDSEIQRKKYKDVIRQAKEMEKQQQGYSEEEFLAFGKSCFYKGFDKAENDDANCYTAFREEIGNLFEQFKKK